MPIIEKYFNAIEISSNGVSIISIKRRKSFVCFNDVPFLGVNLMFLI